MARKRNSLVRIGVAGLLLCMQAACTHQRLWPATYVGGGRTIEFVDSTQFKYRGDSCFLGDSDAAWHDEFSGHYQLQGSWITLEPIHGSAIRGCSIDTRLYLTRVGEHISLVEEGVLQYVVNAQRSGQRVREMYPWHRPGEPDRFGIDPASWLPAPYAGLWKLPAPHGNILAVDDRKEWMGYGAAGREDGMDASARVTIDVGAEAGAFIGMSVCHPDVPQTRFKVTSVTRDTSTFRWNWSVGTTWPTPAVGMPVTTHCPDPPG